MNGSINGTSHLQDAWCVGPLPAASYMCTDIGSGSRVVPKCRPVEMLAFADIVMEPPPEGRQFGRLRTNKVYYVFLTRAQDNDLIVADLKDFVERTVGRDMDPAVDELV